jgi:lysophospholipase L1-like esterase
MRSAWFVLAAVYIALISKPSRSAEPPIGIGVIGDSYSDEYEFYPPDRTTSRNWVECLAATRRLNFGGFSGEGWSEPRGRGFEFNWARNDATTDDAIALGQHRGVARQVTAGAVRYVVVFIGGNDFIHAIESAHPDAVLPGIAPRASRNLRAIVETILAASDDVRLAVVTVPDIRQLPELARAIRTGRISAKTADAYAGALAEFNTEIRRVAITNPRVALVDFDLMTRLANLASRERMRLAGQRLDRIQGANDLSHLFLADGRHLGTFGQAVLAQMVVTALDAKFAAGIERLGDREIREFAESIRTPSHALEATAADSVESAGRRSSP